MKQPTNILSTFAGSGADTNPFGGKPAILVKEDNNVWELSARSKAMIACCGLSKKIQESMGLPPKITGGYRTAEENKASPRYYNPCKEITLDQAWGHDGLPEQNIGNASPDQLYRLVADNKHIPTVAKVWNKHGLFQGPGRFANIPQYLLNRVFDDVQKSIETHKTALETIAAWKPDE